MKREPAQPSKRRLKVGGLLALIVLSVWAYSQRDKAPPAGEPSAPESASAVPATVTPVTRSPAAVSPQAAVGTPAAALVPDPAEAGSSQTRPETSTVAGHDRRIRALLERSQLIRTEETSPDASGAYQRLRVVRSTFKYPLLRVVENFVPDPQSGALVQSGSSAMVANHVVVSLQAGFSVAQLQSYARANGGEIKMQFPAGGRFLIGFAGGENPHALDDMIERLSRSPMIVDPTPDYVVFAY